MDTDKYWLRWSPRNNDLHVAQAGCSIKAAYEQFLNNQKADYITIGEFDSLDAANAVAEKLMPIVQQRDQEK